MESKVKGLTKSQILDVLGKLPDPKLHKSEFVSVAIFNYNTSLLALIPKSCDLVYDEIQFRKVTNESGLLDWELI